MGAGRGICLLQSKSPAVQVVSLELLCVTPHLSSCNSGAPQASSYSAPYFALKYVGSGFFLGLAVIHGVLVQGAMEMHSPHEELALWERREQGLTLLLRLKGRNEHLELSLL